MRKIVLTILAVFSASQLLIAQQGPEQGINARIQPPLQRHDISDQVKALEAELAVASREAEFWRSAHFYNDKKKERMRQERLVFWSQTTVKIRNKITELKKNRSYYQHDRYRDQRYYYKK